MKTFYSWLKKQRKRDDPVGQLAQKAYKKSSAPSGVEASDYRKWVEWVSGAYRVQKSIKNHLNGLDQAFYEWMYDQKHRKIKNLTKDE